MVFGFIIVSSVSGVDVGNPTGQILQDYALNKNNPAVNGPATVKLRSLLEEHVAEFITENRWAPFHEWYGIRTSELSMTEPAQVFYSLSLAYPYLSSQLRDQVRTYMREEWNRSQPFQNLDFPNLGQGAARNWHPIDQNDYSGANGNNISNRIIQIYALYLFAQNTDSWDLVEAQYSTIKSIYESISSTLAERHDANNSRNIHSVIGFIRIADHSGNSTDVTDALSKLETMVSQKLDHQRDEGDDCAANLNYSGAEPGDPGWVSGQFRYGNAFYTGTNHDGKVVQWTDMGPELGRMLRDYATTASSNIATWIYRNAQGFWLVRGDVPVQEGEVFTPRYYTTQNYFHVLSDVQAVDFTAHQQIMDAPACRADVYYMERLVRTIEASGAQNWELYSAPVPPIDETSISFPEKEHENIIHDENIMVRKLNGDQILFQIDILRSKSLDFKIMDISGSVLFEIRMNQTQWRDNVDVPLDISWDLNNIPCGTYVAVLQIETDTGIKNVKRKFAWIR
jgi:hypothetical protein